MSDELETPAPTEVLAALFGREWTPLSPADRALVASDIVGLDCSWMEYRRRIGRGNLQAYVATLRAGRS